MTLPTAIPDRHVPRAGDAPPRDWWNTPWFVVAALLLAATPLLWPAIPPLIDLPSHMSSFYVAANLDTSATLRRYFEFHWQLIGNLGVDLLAIPLAKALGAELATKLVVIMIPVLTVGGMLWVAREIHGELPPTAGFALPLAYCYPLHFGFLNYCLGMALMLLAFALWLRLGRTERLGRRAALFAAIAAAVWVAHAIAWVLLAVACLAAELQSRRARGQAWPRALARALAACATLSTPLILMALAPPDGPGGVHGWFVPHELAKWLVTLFRDRWIAVDLATTALFVAVLLAAAAGRFGLRLRPALAAPALALFAVFVAAPQSINDSGFVNGRIAPYALAVLALAVAAPGASERQRRGLALAATAFLVVRTAFTTASLALYSASYDGHLQALDHIEPGSRVVAFSPVPCGHSLDKWWTPRVYHLASLAIVRKNAFVNTEWQVEGLQLLRVTYAAARPFEADPSETVTIGCEVEGFRRYDVALATVPRQAFDYVWLLEIPRELWPAQSDLQLVWSRDNAALYRIVHGPRQPAD